MKAALAVLWFQAVESASEAVETFSKFCIWLLTKIQAWLLSTTAGVSHTSVVVVATVGAAGATYAYTKSVVDKPEQVTTVSVMPARQEPKLPLFTDAGLTENSVASAPDSVRW
ncbi:MAG TPA: hypothetical protein VFN67_10590 [Polyangiales bacterium]|nr:hypothetical protein [Polyangiales bacterium]